MLNTKIVAPLFTRENVVGKVRRAVGDPVAALKGMTRFLPIPRGAPGVLAVPFAIFDPGASEAAEKAGKLVFHAAGDTGGVNGTATQEAIAEEMEAQVKAASADAVPAFFYNLGDVVYYNGQSELYKTEFYEPYQYYPKLIFAVAGNHDGDTFTRRGDPADTEPSLFGFFENLCAAQPLPVTPYRMTMTQPYVYWTMKAPFVTIIGLYSNVEGSLDARGRMDQQGYLEAQMKAADPAKKLVIAVHHPPFSLDTAHGGNPEILRALDRAMEATGRLPDVVLSGHVHNYQRFSRTVKGKKVAYVVAGAGGYANSATSMHKLQKELTSPPVALPYQTTLPEVKLEKYEQAAPGFLRVTVTAKAMQFEYFRVPFGGTPEVKPFDVFSV